ncbi:hypothetical protein EYF80_017357 [Liparis tanakae]|uniref:Uncharacterized protein n=1 Tax=Liparis tanakae TaxID=230148 RepID=A0A4Z2I3U5_9TELE|nr:hypothetical protein EYF80_017357 [Liparis tanakae]
MTTTPMNRGPGRVTHQWGHGPGFTKGRPVAAPHAAVAHGLSQVATEPVISLWRGEQDAIGPR